MFEREAEGASVALIDDVDVDGGLDHVALIEELDGANVEVACAQRRLFALIEAAARTELWRSSGARDLARWLSMRYGSRVGRRTGGSPPPAP
jgi:hypothetical protein